MPRLSVYFVRASLIYLLLGFSIGGLMLANKGVMFFPAILSFIPLHIEFAFVGWMIQLAMGAAFWILPRFRSGAPRGEERWSWAAFFLINSGILLVVLNVAFPQGWLAFLGRTFEVAGLVTFVIGNWRRIKPFNT